MKTLHNTNYFIIIDLINNLFHSNSCWNLSYLSYDDDRNSKGKLEMRNNGEKISKYLLEKKRKAKNNILPYLVKKKYNRDGLNIKYNHVFINKFIFRATYVYINSYSYIHANIYTYM